MIDPGSALSAAFFHPSTTSFLLVFLAGMMTSIGPCIAPRYIAVAALSATGTQSRPLLVAFVTGLVATYVSFGWIAGALGALATFSSAIDAVLSAGLLAAGAWTLVRPGHLHGRASIAPRSWGAALLLGSASAFVASPCCTPIVASVISYSAISGNAVAGASLLLVFSLGHIAPLGALGVAGARARHAFARIASAQAPAIASGVLMIALGLLYGAQV